jgi:hypothetical protein
MIARALEAGGLDVDRILSVDDVRVYKTDPRVLRSARCRGGPRPHAFRQLQRLGRRRGAARRPHRGLIDRGGEAPAAAPNHRVVSLSEVVALLE